MARKKRCESCGQLKDDAKRVLDPYDLDVNDKRVWKVLCDRCYQERGYDI